MLFFALGIFYFIRLRQFGVPTGVDGYFYLKQIESLSQSFSFYYKDTSFAFALPSFLNFFLRDALVSYQLSICLVLMCTAWCSYQLTRILSFHISGQKIFLKGYLWQYLVIFLFATSAIFLELQFVYLKSATAVMLLMFGLRFMLLKRFQLAFFTLFLCLLTHKTMFIMVPLAVGFWLVGTCLRSAKIFLAAIAAALISAVSLWIFFPRFYYHFSHLFAQASFAKFSLASFEQHQDLILYLIIAAACAIPLMLLSFQKKGKSSWALWFLASLCLLPFLIPDGLDTQSVTYRLILISFPFVIVGLGVVTLCKGPWQLYGVGLAVACAFLTKHYERPLGTWINPWAQRLPQPELLIQNLPADSLIYAPHGAEFYLAYTTPFRPRSLLVESKNPQTYRVAYVRPYLKEGTLLANDMLQMAAFPLSPDFFVFSEADWSHLNGLHAFRPHQMNMLPKKPAFVADY